MEVDDSIEYNELRDKENVVEDLIHLSWESSEPSTLLILFSGSDTTKGEPGGGGGHADLGSMSALTLSPVERTPLQKSEVEDYGC